VRQVALDIFGPVILPRGYGSELEDFVYVEPIWSHFTLEQGTFWERSLQE
jgi:hypothetical protein